MKEKSLIIEEILQTEKKYVEDLKLFKKFYEEKVTNLSQKLVKMFKNIDTILNINGAFLQELEAHQNKTGKMSIGEIFLKFAPLFKLYSNFCKDYNLYQISLREIKKEKKGLDTFNKIEKQVLFDEGGQSFNSYMITPVQRIPRYNLLLKDLIENTEDTDKDKKILKEAFETVQQVANSINQTLKDEEAMTKLLEVNDKLFYRPSDEDKKLELITPHRRLLLSGQMMIIPDGGLDNEDDTTGWKFRMLYLCNDLILICVYSGGDQLLYDNVMFLNKPPIPFTRDLGIDNCFQIVGPFTLTLQSQDKDKWINCLDVVIENCIKNSFNEMKGKQKAIPTYTPKRMKHVDKDNTQKFTETEEIKKHFDDIKIIRRSVRFDPTKFKIEEEEEDPFNPTVDKRKILEEKRKSRMITTNDSRPISMVSEVMSQHNKQPIETTKEETTNNNNTSMEGEDKVRKQLEEKRKKRLTVIGSDEEDEISSNPRIGRGKKQSENSEKDSKPEKKVETKKLEPKVGKDEDGFKPRRKLVLSDDEEDIKPIIRKRAPTVMSDKPKVDKDIVEEPKRPQRKLIIDSDEEKDNIKPIVRRKPVIIDSDEEKEDKKKFGDKKKEEEEKKKKEEEEKKKIEEEKRKEEEKKKEEERKKREQEELERKKQEEEEKKKKEEEKKKLEKERKEKEKQEEEEEKKREEERRKRKLQKEEEEKKREELEKQKEEEEEKRRLEERRKRKEKREKEEEEERKREESRLEEEKLKIKREEEERKKREEEEKKREEKKKPSKVDSDDEEERKREEERKKRREKRLLEEKEEEEKRVLEEKKREEERQKRKKQREEEERLEEEKRELERKRKEEEKKREEEERKKQEEKRRQEEEKRRQEEERKKEEKKREELERIKREQEEEEAEEKRREEEREKRRKKKEEEDEKRRKQEEEEEERRRIEEDKRREEEAKKRKQQREEEKRKEEERKNREEERKRQEKEEEERKERERREEEDRKREEERKRKIEETKREKERQLEERRKEEERRMEERRREKEKMEEEKRKEEERKKEEEKRQKELFKEKRQKEKKKREEERKRRSIPSSKEIEKANTYFEKGRKSLAERDFSSAVDYYTNCIDLDPQNNSACFNRAIANYNLKKFDLVIQDLNEVIDLDPDNSKALTLRATCYKSLNKNEDAIEDLLESLTIDPKSSSNLMSLAICYDKMNKIKDAIHQYSKFLELDSTSKSAVTAYHNRAQNYYEQQDYEKALYDFSKAISICTDENFKIELVSMRAKCLIKVDKIKDAEVEVKNISGNDLEALRNQAQVFYSSKKYKEACEIFGKVLDKEEDYNDYYNRGLCYKNMGKDKESIQDFKNAISLKKDFVNGYKMIAKIYSKNENNDEAINYYTKAIQIKPSEDLYFDRGVLNNLEKKFNEAVSDFTKALQLNPNMIDCYYNRGCIYHRSLKKLEEALDDYNSYLDTEPKDVDVLIDRAILHYQMEDDTLSKKDFLKVLKLDPNNERAKKMYKKCGFEE